MSSEYGFSESDFHAMTHPEGAPGQLQAIYGDRGTTAVLQNTSALTEYYKSQAFKAQAAGAILSMLVVASILGMVPLMILLWKFAL